MALGEAPELNLEDPDWRIPILEWMVNGSSQPTAPRPDESFRLIDGDLYRQGAAEILMSYILFNQGCQLPQDIHAGAYGHHAPPELSSVVPSGMVSTGPQRSPTPRALYEAVKVASSTLGKPPPDTGAPNHPPHLALRYVGARHGGPTKESAGGLHTPSRGDRQILRVD
jgi:hypothetical protein